MKFISSVMVVLMFGNFLQIMIWAIVFMQLGEFTDFATATYHSAVNFATLGYGDITPVNSPAQALAFTEALVGQLYLTVLVARLVGLHISQSDA